jgi:hypothetical protein
VALTLYRLQFVNDPRDHAQALVPELGVVCVKAA